MSVPIVLRWAGVWDDQRTYTYGDAVQSILDSLPYANIIKDTTTTGGVDPSLNNITWIPVPQNSGGGGNPGGATNTVQYNAGSGIFGGNEEFVYELAPSRVVIGESTQLSVYGSLGDQTGGSGQPNQILSSTETGVLWVNPVEPPVYTAGTGINIDLANVISNTGLTNAGLQNRLQIVPALEGQATTTVYYTGAGGVGSPSSWIPDNTSYLPIAGGTNAGWRNFKEVGTSGIATKVAWYPYNPYYGLSLPYTVAPAIPIKKSELQSVWAVITTKNRINVQGEIFFNIFTYDIANPPTPPLAFTNRFDYSILNYPTGEGTATTTPSTLNGGFRYLIYALDAEKYTQPTLTTVAATAMVTGNTYTILALGVGTNWTAIGAAVATVGCVFVKNATVALGTGTGTIEVNTSILIGNGQYPSQGTNQMLNDPYDIYTSIPHISFSAVQVASNTPQPADPSQTLVSAIAISSTSGTVSPTLDWTVEAVGYSVKTATNVVNEAYVLKYTP